MKGRCLLTVLTCASIVIGVCLVGVTAFMMAQAHVYTDLLGPYLTGLGVAFIVVGVVTAAIGAVGCIGSILGAVPKARAVLTAFVIGMVAILVVEMTAVALAIVYHQHVEGFAAGVMGELMEQYKEDDGAELNVKVIDKLQENLKCCGVDGYADWKDLPFGQKTLGLPEYCCQEEDRETVCAEGIFDDDADPEVIGNLEKTIYTNGCLKATSDFVNDRGLWVLAASVLIILFQILNTILGCVVCSKSRENYTV